MRAMAVAAVDGQVAAQNDQAQAQHSPEETLGQGEVPNELIAVGVGILLGVIEQVADVADEQRGHNQAVHQGYGAVPAQGQQYAGDQQHKGDVPA